ncbi:MAG: hypothetical protein AB4041_10870 [Microcystaceae cyanobacterium]
MADIFGNLMTNPLVHQFMGNLMTGEITLLTGVFWLALAGVFSLVGGAIGGMILAGKDLGYELAAMAGSLLGPAAALPVVAIGLVVFKFV